MFNKKNETNEFRGLLEKVYNLNFVKEDPEFKLLIVDAINKINNGNSIDIEIVRLNTFINKYLFINPCQELIDLQIFMQKKINRYRGLINITSWFS